MFVKNNYPKTCTVKSKALALHQQKNNRMKPYTLIFKSTPMTQAIICNPTPELIEKLEKDQKKAEQREAAAIADLEKRKGKKYPIQNQN